MTPDDSYETPFQTDSETQADEALEGSETNADSAPENSANSDTASTAPESPASDELAHPEDVAEVDAAEDAWNNAQTSSDSEMEISTEEEGQLAELAQPFVGRWNSLISTTNWEKGRIISQWREALIQSGVDSHQYSDEAWVRRVGGVTAPHVGRLRRVHDRFATTYETYSGLFWSHFLAALDWEDAPLWLEGASGDSWSVSQMRNKRWEAEGAVESKRPTSSEIVEVETDEDVVLPAQGGGRTKEYGEDSGVASGPLHESPDFGEGEELSPLGGGGTVAANAANVSPDQSDDPMVQPFAGLPELPDDVADAFEALKLAVLRHKTAGWTETDVESVQKYLDAFSVLMR
jgi:hypothetical protein